MANYRITDASDNAVLATGEFDGFEAASTWAQETAQAHVPRPLEYNLEKEDVDGSWSVSMRAGRTKAAE